MDTINLTQARQQLGRIMDRVCQRHEAVVVERQKGASMVMLSLEDFRSLEAACARSQGGWPRSEGMPWVSPYLTVRDAGAALAFYASAIGFQRRNALEDGGRVVHAEMIYRDMVIMLGPEGAFGGFAKAPASGGFHSPVNLYVYCEDVDNLFKRALACGARVIFPPTDMVWGERVCKLLDPDGHVWSFAVSRSRPGEGEAR